MTPYYQDGTLTAYLGDVRDVLRELEDESVNCVVTSPPYYGLRDYGLPPSVWGGDADHDHSWGAMERGKRKDILPADVTTLSARVGTDDRQNGAATNGGRFCECGAWLGNLGLEPTPALFVEHLVAVLREVRRVLRKDGTLWLNLGDSYNNADKWGGGQNPGKHTQRADGTVPSHGATTLRRPMPEGLKPKDRMGIPHRVVFALQDDGWWWRDEIVWHKPNAMPSSVEDRTTPAHEFVFTLTRSRRYAYDFEAIREPAVSGPSDLKKMTEGKDRIGGRVLELEDKKMAASGLTHVGRKRSVGGSPLRERGVGGRTDGYTRMPGGEAAWVAAGRPGRNKRSVWTIATQPFPGAHFATFPEALVEPCVLAGSPERSCPACGAGWIRETETSYDAQGRTTNGPRSLANRDISPGFAQRLVKSIVTTGWRPACDHGLDPVGGVVLDPFGGAGTVALVANRLGRRAIHVELNPDYMDIALRRVRAAWEVPA